MGASIPQEIQKPLLKSLAALPVVLWKRDISTKRLRRLRDVSMQIEVSPGCNYQIDNDEMAMIFIGVE